ncbi:MAG: DUF11 domain-containing protein, partial [Chloroflexi bacterium]|nr:DUF11 domain-containing protein [Chloroflexota bacterium]
MYTKSTRFKYLSILLVIAFLMSAVSPALAGNKTPDVAAAQPADGQPQQIEPGQTPDGLTAPEWDSIQSALAAATIYVDHAATGAATGISWTDAYTNVQDALTPSVNGDQIWVAQGVYTPTLRTDPGSPRTATFTLVEGVALYGGFDGTETSLDQRDWETHITVLSGDLDNNDLTDPYGVVTNTASIVGDNAYHVTTGGGVTETVTVDGFTITAGKADYPHIYYSHTTGGGMLNRNSNPTLTNIIFAGNFASSQGGGLHNSGGGPNLTDVIFYGNASYRGGGIYASYSITLTNGVFLNNSASNSGGGLYINSTGGTSILSNITFTENSAFRGGGMYNTNGYSWLTHVTFNNNSASHGGGMYNDGIRPILSNVTFSNNIASSYGGGLHNSGTHPSLQHVVFFNNSASRGGGIYNYNSNPLLTNVVIDNNIGNYGGGMSNDRSNPLLMDVSFSNNSADNGGGMYNYDSDPILTKVIFTGNSALGSGFWDGGGGMFNQYTSNPILTNVTFTNNSASDLGGGMKNTSHSNPVLTNVIFSNNSAIQLSGGGMSNSQSSPTLTNVTFSSNVATNGGGMYNSANSNPTLINAVLWGNTAPNGEQIHNNGSSIPAISYSDIQDSGGSGAGWDTALGTDGGGNLDTNPLFVDPASGNLHLQLTSPAIDAGDNLGVTVTTDLDGNPRFVDIPAVPDTGIGSPPIADMGAYEAQLVDVALEKTVSPSEVTPGGAMTFTLAVTNRGLLTATQIVLTDSLPAFFSITAIVTDGLVITDTGYAPPYVWAVQNLAPWQSGIITITGAL